MNYETLVRRSQLIFLSLPLHSAKSARHIWLKPSESPPRKQTSHYPQLGVCATGADIPVSCGACGELGRRRNNLRLFCVD